MQYVIVSPHLDDAVLSCGQLLAGRPGGLVATVCTTVAEDKRRLCTSYDRDCGFPNAGQALAARQLEDTLACAYLQAKVAHMPYADQQYGTDFDPAKVAAQLAAMVLPGALVLGPVGLRHPDHLTTAEAVRQLLAARPDLEGWLYEELPSRVLWPEDMPGRMDWWQAVGYNPVRGEPGGGPLEAKEAALLAYRSQRWAWNMHTVLVPERFWRLWPSPA